MGLIVSNKILFAEAGERLNLALAMVCQEKAMPTHSSTLAWRIPGTEEPGGLQSMGSLRVGHDWATSLSRIGEGNGNPLQRSCLDNPRDWGAWWAAVYGVAQSRTRLKWLSSSSSSMVCQGFPSGSAVKNLPAMQETWVWSLGWADPLEEEMSTHSRSLAWKISWTEETGRLQCMESKRVGHDLMTKQWHGLPTPALLLIRSAYFKCCPIV